MPRTGSPRGAHLVVLAARLQQALLDGELQQVVVLVPQGLAAPRAQHRVARRHLEHPRLHLAREGPACGTATAGGTAAARGGPPAPRSAPRSHHPHGDPPTPMPPPAPGHPHRSPPGPGGCAPGGWAGAQTRTEPSGWSQPQRLLKVMRALRTWKRGISGGTKGVSGSVPGGPCPSRSPRPRSPNLTNLDGEARGQLEGDEVAQLGEVGVGDGHQVDDGRHLLRQRQRVLLA